MQSIILKCWKNLFLFHSAILKTIYACVLLLGKEGQVEKLIQVEENLTHSYFSAFLVAGCKTTFKEIASMQVVIRNTKYHVDWLKVLGLITRNLQPN